MVPKQLGIGHIVWWSLPDEIPVSRENWDTQYPDFPLPVEPLGDPLRRALFRLEAPRGAKRLVRPLRQRDRWGLVIEVASQDDLTYSVELICQLTHKELWFPIRPVNGGFYSSALARLYKEELGKVTSSTVADLVLSHIRGTCLAVQARKTGGVYFVPQERAAEMAKVTELVESIGGSLYSFPVMDQVGSRQNLVRLVVEDLRGAVDAVRGNLSARHKADAVLEARQALDRVRFYSQALEVAAESASTYEGELNELLAEALIDKRKETR